MDRFFRSLFPTISCAAPPSTSDCKLCQPSMNQFRRVLNQVDSSPKSIPTDAKVAVDESPKEQKQPQTKTDAMPCPVDVVGLGQASWTILHTLASNFPDTPSTEQQLRAKRFVELFSQLYPCHICQEEFESYVQHHPPITSTRSEFSKWMCDLHNHVNVHLGKPTFDCTFNDARWRADDTREDC
eukprot:TRINITY_DN6542_c0_g1_i1.p1 TRINITY_DN6542_c0_g1~~TRINITY_DN6542_c0_g1_i1.p1  ORF type:complete len:184 (+),score=39.66 TRINITY_DN6542_c0_g1_i1:39-590(+)